MERIEFLRPRLVGARFEDKSIPLEFLKDLAVLNDLIVDVAKSEFLKDHRERLRSPRGFTDGIELKLTGVEEGSAIPVITLFLLTETLFPLENRIYFERARDAMINAIDAAAQNRSPKDYLPEKALGYFEKMGRSLREEEAIEFIGENLPTSARLNKETRRKLVLASSTIKELTEEISIRGTVPEADQDDMTFEVQLWDNRKIRAPIQDQHLETIIEAFNGYKSGMKVMLQGIGRFDRKLRLQSCESVQHLSILDELDVPARLDELRLLKYGWLEGGGLAPSPQGLDWLSQVFDKRYPDIALPYIYPTSEGNIQAEWSFKPLEITLEIDLNSHQGEWVEFNLETDDEKYRSLCIDSDEDWIWFVNRIKYLSERAHD